MHLINVMMAVGAVVAAAAVGGICLVGMVVWLCGWNWNPSKPAK